MLANYLNTLESLFQSHFVHDVTTLEKNTTLTQVETSIVESSNAVSEVTHPDPTPVDKKASSKLIGRIGFGLTFD